MSAIGTSPIEQRAMASSSSTRLTRSQFRSEVITPVTVLLINGVGHQYKPQDPEFKEDCLYKDSTLLSPPCNKKNHPLCLYSKIVTTLVNEIIKDRFIKFFLVHNNTPISAVMTHNEEAEQEVLAKIAESSGPVIIFAHSHGTDVVDQVFYRRRPELKTPVLIINLGGIRTHKIDAPEVTVISFIGHDFIARLARICISMFQNTPSTMEEITIGNWSHDFTDYLKVAFVDSEIKRGIKNFIKNSHPFHIWRETRKEESTRLVQSSFLKRGVFPSHIPEWTKPPRS